jgi:hypothetical protein
MLPIERLHMMGSKRLWYEMEDDPLYSRFIQSMIHLLSEIKVVETEKADLTRQIGGTSPCTGASESTTTGLHLSEPNNIRSVLRFDSSRSHVQLSPQKDLSGPWTVEFWLWCDEVQITTVEAPPPPSPSLPSSLPPPLLPPVPAAESRNKKEKIDLANTSGGGGGGGGGGGRKGTILDGDGPPPLTEDDEDERGTSSMHEVPR